MVAFSMAGCSVTKRNVAVDGFSTLPQKNARLVAGRSGAYVALKKGGTLTLVLDSPSNGRWNLAPQIDKKRNVLEVVSRGGGGNTQEWKFKAIGRGAEEVRMVYERPWSQGTDPVHYDLLVVADRGPSTVVMPRGGSLGFKFRTETEHSRSWDLTRRGDPVLRFASANPASKTRLLPIALSPRGETAGPLDEQSPGNSPEDWQFSRVGPGTTKVAMKHEFSQTYKRKYSKPVTKKYEIDYGVTVEAQ
jgi:predicted secreted protein